MTNKDKDPFGFDKAVNWDKLNDPNGNAISVTRAHEAMFGTLIPRAVGEDAPEGKYKVVLTNPLPN